MHVDAHFVFLFGGPAERNHFHAHGALREVDGVGGVLEVVDHGVGFALAGDAEGDFRSVVCDDVGGDSVYSCAHGQGIGVEYVAAHEVDGEIHAVEVGKDFVVLDEGERPHHCAAVEFGVVFCVAVAGGRAGEKCCRSHADSYVFSHVIALFQCAKLKFCIQVGKNLR